MVAKSFAGAKLPLCYRDKKSRKRRPGLTDDNRPPTAQNGNGMNAAGSVTKAAGERPRRRSTVGARSCAAARRPAAAKKQVGQGIFSSSLDDIPTGWYASRMTPQPVEPSSSGGARCKLLDAAFAIIREKGYTATSVDELCAQAGVTKGAFFHHFQEQGLARGRRRESMGGDDRRVFRRRSLPQHTIPSIVFWAIWTFARRCCKRRDRRVQLSGRHDGAGGI